jgi:hypothetical protein
MPPIETATASNPPADGNRGRRGRSDELTGRGYPIREATGFER